NAPMSCLNVVPDVVLDFLPGRARQERNSSTTFYWGANPSGIARQPYARELPARLGREKVAVSGADVVCRRGARAAAQHVLVAHELAVVFAHRPRGRRVARIGV